ncbi:phosphate ABC transporter substrate-binding protein [Vallitalea sp.]|jgi:phosphate transport system substrate-binding protein|uniref:phosphate ABC transporter substrate-binding protein n=1 Tax=Vallitalea sp. TaxID=1882829 RepID=UPI0025E9B80E|nr:phosphate ABC transporter substrate-binding protein [Vallitalea sp.]MCT4687950.1 phosphate ABC transporter substrate-binding protein [Vallitalea sp.]
MKKIRNVLMVALIVVSMLAFAGCKSDTDNNKDSEQDDKLSGLVSVSGSTSVEKIGIATAEEFMALNPDVEVTYEGIGSSNGVKNSKDGVTILGTASRNLKAEEKNWGLTEVAIAYDGVAVITHPSNEVSELTKEQVQGIYKGEITNWKYVGGKDEEIVVVSREDGSGTRGAFEEIVDFEDALTEKAIIAKGNGNVQTTVAKNNKAIGYVSFTYINDTVKPFKIDGAQPNSENVVGGKYSISRPFLLIYKEENMTKESKAFVDFILSPEGQDIVEEKGGIKVN